MIEEGSPLTLRWVEVGRDHGRVVLVAGVLAVPAAASTMLATRRRLKWTGGQADYGGRIKRGRSRSRRSSRGVHVLVRAHLLPETRPSVAEPYLDARFGKFGPGKVENK